MRGITFFTLVFLILWTGKALSQNVPFPQNDALWKEEHITFAGPVLKYFALCGDTVIDGTSYAQVVELQVDNAMNVVGKTFLGGLRSGGPVVRYLPVWASFEYVLYDFSLQEEDVIDLLPLYGAEPITRKVDSVKMETLEGKLRKVIYFHPGPGEAQPEYWVEGIGSSYGLLGRAIPPGGDIGFTLLCYQHDAEYVNFTDIECFLPELTGCDLTSSSAEPDPEQPLKLTASPNPAGKDVRFFANRKNNLEGLTLKIYAANGKLLSVSEHVMQEMLLPGNVPLASGFYIAVLESKKTGRVMAHCTFILGKS